MTETLPPDAGSPYRKAVNVWDGLWRAVYRYDAGDRYDRLMTSTDDTATAAPGYTRSFSHLIAGLFERQTPSFVPDTFESPRLSPQALSDVLHETVAKAAGYGAVVIRPVFDGEGWQPSIVASTQFSVRWAHRRPVEVVMWEYGRDPRKPDDTRAGLALIETWTPSPDGPGVVSTVVRETVQTATGGVELGKPVDVMSPPDSLADHPFVVSASNDVIRRDVAVFVWQWEQFGPVPLWYTAEHVVVGLARLWDQEQDDAEMTRKRVAMPRDLLGTDQVVASDGTTVLARPGFRKHDNLLLLGSSMVAEHGPGGGVTPIEFGDDLVQRERIERRENALLEMVGINPASIGRNVGGRSDSGVAKRADNQMTMNTITSPARRVETVLSDVTVELARLNGDSAPVGVAVYEGLKESPAESADVAKSLRDAEAASTETLVRTAHPTWSPEQVTEEVDRMQAENRAVAPFE